MATMKSEPNTQVYKTVHGLAEEMMRASYRQEDEKFSTLYEQLNALCIEHERTDKNHPVQWETLADFTEDSDQALAHYKKALRLAKTIDNREYVASICYAMAVLLKEVNKLPEALALAEQAAEAAQQISDDDLKEEIKTLLGDLQDV
ncbi:MAG: tetratricopeptide repeat protein [Pseudomonadales bacterium]